MNKNKMLLYCRINKIVTSCQYDMKREENICYYYLWSIIINLYQLTPTKMIW